MRIRFRVTDWLSASLASPLIRWLVLPFDPDRARLAQGGNLYFIQIQIVL